MNEYCKQTELQPRYDHLELYTLKHFPVLIDLLQITKNVDLIMFSILSLPENQKLLDEVVKISIENKIKIHFANENLVLEDLESWENIQKHLAFR